MDKALKSCPLCGGHVTFKRAIVCDDCGCMLPYHGENTEDLWNSSKDTLACPLCGEYAYESVGPDGYSISCSGCGFETKKFVSREEAKNAWNKRVNRN